MRALDRRVAEQCRRRVEFLEVAADRDTFAQGRAVVEFEHRQLAERVLGAELGCFVRALGDRHTFVRDLERFFSEEDANSARIGGRVAVTV